MGEASYIGSGAIIAAALAAGTEGVTLAAEYLVGEQQAAAGIESGTLRGSIHVAEIVTSGSGATARTSTGGEAGAYAIFHHEGTSAHLITASGANALFWPGAAHPVKQVHHPGTAPNKFMEGPLIASAPLLREFIARAVAAAF